MTPESPFPEQPDQDKSQLTDEATSKLLDEIERKSEEMQAKIYEAGHVPLPDTPEWTYKPKQKSKVLKNDAGYQSLGMGLFIVYLWMGFLILGFGGGSLLDHHYGTQIFYTSILGFGSIFLALVSTILFLTRHNGTNIKK